MIHAQTLAGVSVLLLEDSYYIAEESMRTLEDAGARVLDPCRNIDETLEVLRRDCPDCAVVDINLGNGPSFEPARALRAAGVPVILMTGYDAVVVPADLQDAPCLQKPVEGRRLIRAVASISRQ